MTIRPSYLRFLTLALALACACQENTQTPGASTGQPAPAESLASVDTSGSSESGSDSTFFSLLRSLNPTFDGAEWLKSDRGMAECRAANRISDFDDIIKKMARRYGFDWRLIAAQIYAESNFKTEAKSRVGALGLMQLMPTTARSLGYNVNAVRHPENNIAAGCYYNQKMYSLWSKQAKHRDHCLALSLASYNAGRGRVLQCLGDDGKDQPVWDKAHPCLAAETQLYVYKIFLKHDCYKKRVLP